MTIIPKNTIDQARKAKERVKFMIETLPQLVTLGIAHNNSGYFLKVYLSQPVPKIHSIPSSIEGITVETEVVGTFTYPSVQLLPSGIKNYLTKLTHAQKSESDLYKFSDFVAEWLIDAPNEYLDECQTFLASYIQVIPPTSSRILLAALSNAEFSNSNESLLTSVSLFLKSSDKRLAQTAAAFLLTCGGALGRDFLFQILSTQELPHSQLIKGIIELLSGLPCRGS